MLIVLSFFFFALGAIVGSFLNVVILRYKTGLSILSMKANTRSMCMSCGKGLKWYELLPVVSYLFLLGKCSKCHSKISPQYPIVELVTGFLFLLTFLKFQSLLFFNVWIFIIFMAFFLFIISLYVVIFVYDMRHKIIPDVFSYTLALLTFLYALFITILYYSQTVLTYLNLFGGIILFIPFYLLWKLSKGKWMGLGDGKLALSIGWLLGFIYGLNAIVIGFWLGAIYGVCLLLINKILNKKGVTMKSEIPFGPFLIIGTLMMFFFPFDIFSLSFYLY